MEGNYSMGDVLFFTDSKYDTDNSKYFSVPIPKDWEEFRESEWTYIIPLKNNMQRQGWKVHISSTLENTDEILTIVSEYCYKKTLFLSIYQLLNVLLIAMENKCLENMLESLSLVILMSQY